MDNYGMLLEILTWLPVKSLLRFMCVCKYWETLISSHPFRKLHREKNTSFPPLLVACHSTCALIENPPNYPMLQMYTHLITSDLEGKSVEETTLPLPLSLNSGFDMKSLPYHSKLLCFVNYQSRLFYLYNPSTRQFCLLTNPSCFSSPEFEQHCSAAYGYIPSKDEYIMVHLVKLSNEKLYCEVLNNISISNDNFKLHYNQWRSSIGQVTTIIRDITRPGVFVDGAFYWEANLNKESIILSFDIKTECFSTFATPDGLLDNYSSLLELNGELYLYSFPKSRATLVVLWKFSSDNKSWTRYRVFDFKEMFGFTNEDMDECKFNLEIFLYRVTYLGIDHKLSANMGKLLLKDGDDLMPRWIVETHTNLFTL